PLRDCFAILTILTQGTVGTQVVPIGRLAAGTPRTIETKLPTHVESVCSLHICTGGLEVRSTFHREAYDVIAFYAAAVRGAHGLSALELLKSADYFPHELSADGRLLATVRKRDAKKRLIVYDLESMKLLCDVPAADSDLAVQELNWVSDHEVAYVSEDRK